MQFKTYEVRKNNVGMPLSTMLKRIFADRSWNDVKRLVTSRRVQINGNLCTDDTRRLKAGEIVRIAQESLDKPPDEEQITVRFQDEHLLVVEKPAGVTTLRHAEEKGWDERRKNRQPTLDEMLQKLVDRNGVARTPGRGAGGRPAKRNEIRRAGRTAAASSG